MRQKKIILTDKTPENSSSKLPHAIRFYRNSTGDALNYFDGAIPFLISFYDIDGAAISSDFDIVHNGAGKPKIAPITKRELLETFYVYRIADYAHQSLSAGFSDFIPYCYDSNGYKLPQYKLAIIKKLIIFNFYLLKNYSNAQIDIS